MMRLGALGLSLFVLICSPEAEAKKGPKGKFVGESGKLTLDYLGEGMVSVKLKTKYCSLETEDGGTFIFPHVHVLNKKGETVLVIFYQRKKSIVYAVLPAFERDHCKGGLDATGVYKRKR